MNYSEWEVETPEGYQSFSSVRKLLKPFYYHFEFVDGSKLKCSADHKIMTSEGWKEAKDISFFDCVIGKEGDLEISFINIINDEIEVYDLLEVLNGNQYYTNGILSHNCSFIGSSGTLISGAKLKSMVHKTPVFDKNDIKQYIPPESGKNYVMVVDPGEGKGLDYSAIQVIDITKMPYEQVCVYQSNLVTPADFAEVIFRMGKTYNNCPVLIEINSIGGQVSYILQNELEYENILRTTTAGRSGKQITYNIGKNTDNGLRTTVSTKATGCSLLKLIIEADQLIINDWQTIEQLSRFSRKGRSYEAESGAHDDLIMPLVIFAWLTDQKYFKEYTDINTLTKIRQTTEEELNSSFELIGYVLTGDETIDEPIIDDSKHISDLFSASAKFKTILDTLLID